MKILVVLVLVLVFADDFVSSSFVEDEDGSLNHDEKEPSMESKRHQSQRFKWRRCRPASQCGPGYYCYYYWCYPRYQCNHHTHCPQNWYCHYGERVCKPGIRKCRSNYDCSRYYQYCKNGVCTKLECRYHSQCPSGKYCVRPGVCQPYKQQCKRHYQCITGYVCYQGWCKKRECSYHSQCPHGQTCVSPGVCKPRPGYCTNQESCAENQCCLRRGNSPHGRCNKVPLFGEWCDMKPYRKTCPCVAGHVCVRVRGNWGRCRMMPTTSPPPTEEPGSGSGDFEH